MGLRSGRSSTILPLPASPIPLRREQLEPFDLLGVLAWVFDVERGRFWWANRAAVAFWGSETLEDLLLRDARPRVERRARAPAR